jgi:hypothetical protein
MIAVTIMGNAEGLHWGSVSQDIRVNSEWTRWQEADKWAWDEGKRRRWAEGLWRHQARRALARDATRRAIAAAEARQRLEVGVQCFSPALCIHAAALGGVGARSAPCPLCASKNNPVTDLHLSSPAVM